MRRCLAILTLVAGLAILTVGGVAAVDNGAMIFRSPTDKRPGDGPIGCYLPGPNLQAIWTEDCSYQVVSAPNGTYRLEGHGQLPSGTALPDRAFHTTPQEYGFSKCLTPGDQGDYVVTPSGRVNFTCTNR